MYVFPRLSITDRQKYYYFTKLKRNINKNDLKSTSILNLYLQASNGCLIVQSISTNIIDVFIAFIKFDSMKERKVAGDNI